MKRFFNGAGAPALIALVAFAYGWMTHTETPPGHDVAPPPPPAYTDEARAMLGGLEVGDEIDPGFRVVDIYGPHEGRLVIELELQDVPVEVSIVRLGTTEAVAPVSDSRFDYLFSAMPDQAATLPFGATDAMVNAISDRVVLGVPIPAGM